MAVPAPQLAPVGGTSLFSVRYSILLFAVAVCRFAGTFASLGFASQTFGFASQTFGFASQTFGFSV